MSELSQVEALEGILCLKVPLRLGLAILVLGHSDGSLTELYSSEISHPYVVYLDQV